MEATVTGLGDEVVVFVHGMMDRGRSFEAAAELLGEFRSVHYDRAGYGRSRGRLVSECHSLERHVDDLVEVLDEHTSAGDRVVLVGHSFGGHVALMAAARDVGRVAAVGMWEPPMPWLEWWPAEARDYVEWVATHNDLDEVASSVIAEARGPDFWARLEEAQKERIRNDVRALKSDMLAELAAPFDPAEVSAPPTVIGRGTNSNLRDGYEGAPRIAQALDATLVEYDAYHNVQRSSPETLAAFVRTVVEAGRRPPR